MFIEWKGRLISLNHFKMLSLCYNMVTFSYHTGKDISIQIYRSNPTGPEDFEEQYHTLKELVISRLKESIQRATIINNS